MTQAPYPHQARKRFGQNFLRDHHVIHNIQAAIDPQLTDHIVEIGPGQGALTENLLRFCGQLDVIELDRDLCPRLQSQFGDDARFHLHQGDALKFDFATLTDKPHSLRLVGNLPYNISTPLLFHFIDYLPLINDIHIMLQKEVVDRLAAAPSNADYGRLSVMIQYHCDVVPLIDVPPTAFTPQPKVQSGVVRLTPYDKPPFVAHNLKMLTDVVRASFSQRRKTLRNNLKHFINDELLSALNIDLSLRPENISVEQYVTISNQVNDYEQSLRR